MWEKISLEEKVEKIKNIQEKTKTIEIIKAVILCQVGNWVIG